MQFELASSMDILRRTPATLRALLETQPLHLMAQQTETMPRDVARESLSDT